MENTDYFTIAQPARQETRVQRSRFIGSLSPAPHREAAESGLERIRREFHDATHHCYAYRIDANEFRYSDGGEPSGTAGLPILKVLDKYCLLQSLLVVTRYFGGIKLGPGGLSRAYSQCAEETIQKSSLQKLIQYCAMTVQYPYGATRQIHYLVDKYGGEVDSSEFAAEVISRLKIPSRNQPEFERELLQAGAGQVKILHREESTI